MLEYFAAIAVVLIYIGIFVAIRRYKVGGKWGLGTTGPLIMWKTSRGKVVIDRISRHERVWKVAGDVSIGVVLVLFTGMLILLLWEATVVMTIPRERAPQPQTLLGIPGLNPVIPVGYGILGLVIGIITHEFSHGIMARAQGLKVQSLGLIFLIVPLGAFVEPDEDELKKTERRKRMRVYAAGPASNILVSTVTLVLYLLLITSVHPVAEGCVVAGVGTDSPASRSGIQQYTLITSINGTKITSAESIFNISGIQPGTKVRLQGLYRGSHIEYECYAGVSLIEIVKGFPAEEGGLKPGMILISIEGHSNTTRIMNQNDLSRTLSWMMPGDRINVSVYEWEKNRSSYIMRSFAGITLTSKYEYYAKYAPGLNREEYKSVAFLGITSGYMGMIFVDTEDLIRPSAAPFSGAESVTDYFLSGLRFLSLPLLGLSPIDSPVSDLYAPGGVLGSTPSPLFWIAVNSLYWIFWISIMLGLTNALTLFVTDGTPIFKDSLDYLCIRANYNPEKREKLTSSLTAFFSFLVVFLILWQMIGPRIV